MAACKTPQLVYNKYLGKKVWSECRKCSACLENRRQGWHFRFQYEKMVSGICTHLTLQFSDNYIKDNVLHPKEFTDFVKRLRSMGFVFKYYVIGEYGTKDKRKHYHSAVFLHSDHSFETFQNAVIRQWRFGYVYFTKLTLARMGYILHFHVRPKEVDGKKTYSSCSQGIGMHFLESPRLQKYLINTKSISVQAPDSHFYTLPRYYRKKLGISLPDDTIPAVVETFAQIKKCKVSEISKEELKSYLTEIHKRELIRIDNYNKQSN